LFSTPSLAITGTLSANGSTGTAGYVLTSNGSSAAYWAAPSTGLTQAKAMALTFTFGF